MCKILVKVIPSGLKSLKNITINKQLLHIVTPTFVKNQSWWFLDFGLIKIVKIPRAKEKIKTNPKKNKNIE